MLFKFSYFWTVVFALLGSWILYGLCGYEFTVVTLLASILALKLKE